MPYDTVVGLKGCQELVGLLDFLRNDVTCVQADEMILIG